MLRELQQQSLACDDSDFALGHCEQSALCDGIFINDSQSKLNSTRVRHLCRPASIQEIVQLISFAKQTNTAISVSGGRHAMGGQQFGHDNLQLDMSGFDQIVQLDHETGLVVVESGIEWPKLMQDLVKLQACLPEDVMPWVIREKQTGVDSVSVGGSLSANMHGRGLRSRPFVDSIESFRLIDHEGNVVNCSRDENQELFSLAIGGYGMFGIVATVTLRLVRRFKVRRHVQQILAMDSVAMLEQRRESGFAFGDCQYAIDLTGSADQHQAVLPCYLPVDFNERVTQQATSLAADDWAALYQLARTDKRKAFEIYAMHYLSTDGQVYWSDTHQLSNAFSGYHAAMDAQTGTEMITEIYLDHDKAIACLESIRDSLAAREADITYGTIRLIEADEETFLPWARRRSVCIIANLHCPRNEAGIRKTKENFREILDRTIAYDGSFYLTYHRWATADQIEAAYPKIREFFKLKKHYDPKELFQSSWYRHYRASFG